MKSIVQVAETLAHMILVSEKRAVKFLKDKGDFNAHLEESENKTSYSD